MDNLPPNKVRVSFELDLTDHPGVRVDSLEEIRGSIQNLSAWLHNLENFYHEKGFIVSSSMIKSDPELAEAIYKHSQRQIELAKQIFNNFQVEGTMADGSDYVFTHDQDYNETLTVNGQAVDEY